MIHDWEGMVNPRMPGQCVFLSFTLPSASIPQDVVIDRICLGHFYHHRHS